jgi:hypothetical protein
MTTTHLIEIDRIDDEQTRILSLADKFAPYLKTFNFNGLDELTSGTEYGGDFINWFLDDERYRNEQISLIERSAFWVSKTALDVATDYAEYLVKMEG